MLIHGISGCVNFDSHWIYNRLLTCNGDYLFGENEPLSIRNSNHFTMDNLR